MKKSRIPILLLVLLAANPLQAGIETRTITYEAGGTSMTGYLAWDTAFEGKQPGVLVVHEWWGLNDYARKRARDLAALGYTALAVDMYGNGKTAKHPEDAGTFAKAVMKNPDAAIARFEKAMEVLKSQPTVDPGKIAAIGYCFGGSIVLNMARTGVDLDAVVSFHGSLGGLMPVKGPIRAKVLVCHGEDDPFTTDDQIAHFKKEMTEAGADFEFVAYPGAKHSFTNPDADAAGKEFGLPLAYNAEADAESWQAMKNVLNEAFTK